jgi:hypothetical protein
LPASPFVADMQEQNRCCRQGRDAACCVSMDSQYREKLTIWKLGKNRFT